MRLDPGFYKLKRGRGIYATYHYLRVMIKNRKYFYQIDHGIPQEMSEYDQQVFVTDDFQVLKKISKLSPPKYQSIRFSVSFEDEDGHRFKMAATNRHAFDNILKSFPRLKKLFFDEEEIY